MATNLNPLNNAAGGSLTQNLKNQATSLLTNKVLGTGQASNLGAAGLQ